MQALRVYGADFETDRDDPVTRAWVCQWALAGPTGDSETDIEGIRESHGSDIVDFCAILERFVAESGKNKRFYIYFHNLRFDIQFLRTWLHKMSLQHPTTWIMRDGAPLIMRIGYLEIRDSMAKMPGSLKSLGASIGVPKLAPPTEDFRPGWSSALTGAPEESVYVIRDATIPAVAMARMHRMGMTHATTAGDAWASVVRTWVQAQGYSYANPDYIKSVFMSHFPPLQAGLDAMLRKAYFGGLNISRHRGLTCGEITHEDVHSMYPTVMSYDLLPYGPCYALTEVTDDYPLWIMRAEIKLRLREGAIPWYRFRARVDRDLEGLAPGEPVSECAEWHLLTLTSVDLETLDRFYEIDIRGSVDLWGFRAERGALKPYIDQWYEEKSKHRKGTIDYIASKLMLNSAYGRFAMRAESDSMGIVWDDDIGDYAFKVVGVEESEPEAYLPYGIFVTAHARRRLLEGVLSAGSETVIHCDTDSVIHTGPPSALGHEDKLGDWDVESRPVRIYEGGYKRYVECHRWPIERLDDISMACAGVPQHVNDAGVPVGMWVELLDDPPLICEEGAVLGQEHYRVRSEWLRRLYLDAGMDPDDVDTRKLLPKKVRGGVYLAPTTYALNDNMIWRLR